MVVFSKIFEVQPSEFARYGFIQRMKIPNWQMELRIRDSKISFEFEPISLTLGRYAGKERREISFGLCQVSPEKIKRRKIVSFILKLDGTRHHVQRFGNLEFDGGCWYNYNFHLPINTDFEAEGLLLEGGVIKIGMEMDLELPDEFFSDLGLDHLKNPITDPRTIETFRRVEDQKFRENASFLIEASDRKEFFAERAIFMSADEGDFFKVSTPIRFTLRFLHHRSRIKENPAS
jgi:hypothetical protein